jgi:hypothetical protein
MLWGIVPVYWQLCDMNMLMAGGTVGDHEVDKMHDTDLLMQVL